MSSSKPIAPSVISVETINGTIQVSRGGNDSSIGLLVERDERVCGTLLTEDQATKLAEQLTKQSRSEQRKEA